MARKKKQENEEILQQAYVAIVNELKLNKEDSVNSQVHQIILYADDLQSTICQKADYIKIDAFADIKERWPELGIPKNVWLELVHLRRLQRHTSLSDDFIAKIAMSFEGAKNVTAFRSAMLDAIKNNDLEISVPTADTTKQLEFEATEQLDEDFVTLLDECADLRHELDSVLWQKMRVAGNAFCYLTKEPYGTFKELLDLWHYRNGGWPKPTTPPRIWGTIFRFIHQYDLLDQYGFDMAKSWCGRLGLKTERTLMSPTAFQFTEQGARFGKYFMAKLKDDTQMNYPQYRFEPWHHIIGNTDNDSFFAYVWDTRIIEFGGKLSDLKITDLRTDYQDSCAPLKFDDNKIGDSVYEFVKETAKHSIPDALLAESTDKSEQTRIPEDFAQAAAKRKAELLKLHSTPEELEVIGDDPVQKFLQYQEHPELDYVEGYNTKWRNDDPCENQFLGFGRITGANFETGRLIVDFAKYGTYEAWPWHLNKLEEA